MFMGTFSSFANLMHPGPKGCFHDRADLLPPVIHFTVIKDAPTKDPRRDINSR